MHRISCLRLAPLNERGQGAVKEPVAVQPDRNLPLQQAFGRFAAGMDDGPTINALGFPCVTCVLDVACIGHKMNEARGLDQLSLELRVV